MYPDLSSIYKAAVVKTMLYWLAAFLRDEVGTLNGRLRYSCANAFAKFQHLLDDHQAWFTPSETQEVVGAIRKGLVLYQKLASQDKKTC